MSGVDLSQDGEDSQPSPSDKTRLLKTAQSVLDTSKARRNQRWLALTVTCIVVAIFLCVMWRLSGGLAELIAKPSEIQKTLEKHIAEQAPLPVVNASQGASAPAVVPGASQAKPNAASAPAKAASGPVKAAEKPAKDASPLESLIGELRTVVTSVVAVISVLVVAISVLAITMLRMTFTREHVEDSPTSEDKSESESSIPIPGLELAKEISKAVSEAVGTVVKAFLSSKQP